MFSPLSPLVCGCDGIHSKVRELSQGHQPDFDTHWLAWTWWGPEGIFPQGVTREYWGRGVFFGVYPVPGKATYVCAVPARISPPEGASDGEVLSVVRDGCRELIEASPEVGKALDVAEDLFLWPMRDVRAADWSRGRVVLCGDAGTAFLPTAGLGASAALRSAAVLGDELSRADARLVPIAIEMYEKRARHVIQAFQQESRMLAKLMFSRTASSPGPVTRC